MSTIQFTTTTPARFPLKVIEPVQPVNARETEETPSSTTGLSDACRGWYIARGPVPTLDPEVWGAIANALDAQAPEWNPVPRTANTTLADEEAIKILSKPAAGSNIGLTLYDEYILKRTQGL